MRDGLHEHLINNDHVSGHQFGFSNQADNNNNNCIQWRKSRFFTISSLRREPSPTRTLEWPGRNRVQITCNTSSAYHVQRVVLRATWYEGTALLLSLTNFKSHLFEVYFTGWTINRWRRVVNWSTRRKPLATSSEIICATQILKLCDRSRGMYENNWK